jgi:tetratricopeptide (TPR) repeat protein
MELERRGRGTDRAIEIDPKFARAHHVRAFMMMILGRHEEAIASIDRAAEFDPANLVIKTDKGNLLSAANRIDEAFEQWDHAIAIDPTFILAREHRIVGYERIGSYEQALRDHLEVLRLKNTKSKRIAEVAELGRQKGFPEIRRREFNDLLARKKSGEKVSPTHLALYCALLGNADDAFRCSIRP